MWGKGNYAAHKQLDRTIIIMELQAAYLISKNVGINDT